MELCDLHHIGFCFHARVPSALRGFVVGGPSAVGLHPRLCSVVPTGLFFYFHESFSPTDYFVFLMECMEEMDAM